MVQSLVPSPDERKAEMNMSKVLSLTKADVISVYSGRDGACCCGCAGKHTYNSAYIEEAGKRRGYPLDKDTDVNDATVTRVLNVLKRDSESVLDFGKILSLILGRRLYVVY